jgi:hypothetical protein
MSFNDFEQLVDSSVKKISGKRKSVEEFGKPYYENKDVKIFLGDTKQKCIEYGQAGRYGLCISRLDGSNLFHSYRAKGATFYFVYFKQKQKNAPEGFVVIHAYPKDTYHFYRHGYTHDVYQINYASENRDFTKPKKEIIKEFPVLKNLFKNVIVYKPLSEEEKRIYDKIQNANFLKLKNINDKLMYIELGQSLDGYWDDILKSIPENELKIILKKYIEVGISDIPWRIINEHPKLKKRYIQKLKQRIQIKIDINAPHDEFTEHELDNMPEYLNSSPEVQFDAISKNGSLIRYIKNPSLEVQLTAINQSNGWAIEHITNPSLEVQLAAVNQNGLAIRFIDDPSEEVQWAAVEQNGCAIGFIKNPTEKMKWVAVQQNPVAIYHIENPTLKMKWTIIKNNPYSIAYIKEPEPEIQKFALAHDKEKMLDIFMNLISQHNLHNPIPEMQKFALAQEEEDKEEALDTFIRVMFQGHFNNPIEEIQLVVAEENPDKMEKLILSGQISNPSEKVIKMLGLREIDWRSNEMTPEDHML